MKMSPTPSTPGHSLSVERVAFSELPDAVLEVWSRWAKQPAFYSPYFHPAFTKCAAQVRDDVRVMLGYVQEKLVAIFPYQRCGRNLIEPVGGAINDYHAVLCDNANPISITELLKCANVGRLKFHSWLAPYDDIQPHIYSQVEASVADFSHGKSRFLDELSQKSTTISRHPQKCRKLMREIGPLRLELDCSDPPVLDWIIQKKREKYQRTGVIDFFGVAWTRDLLSKICQTNTPDFGGMLSALYAGDQLVAAHIGMRCGSTLHYWYPVYDTEYRKYSPGTQLFLEIVGHSNELGIQRIDFGYGEDPYKDKLTNQKFLVARGCIDFNKIRSSYKRQVDQLVSKVKSSPAKQPLKRIVRIFMPGAGQPRV
ncbi:GNAT family N-acetyltransferase [bacterium]|nr:GNAT family N-acetyltransferase [bacterium]